MKLEEFDYELPEELIAQTPLVNRAESKLMVLDKVTGEIEHKKFYEIIEYLNPGDVLVLNDTKVISSRIYGTKLSTDAKIEVLLLKELENDTWEALVRPAKRVKVGTKISFGDGVLIAECIESFDEGIRHFKMSYEGIFLEILDKIGNMPLPPYIHQKLNDKNRYQTVYAKYSGSAAAPTAGLHFTKELLEKIKAKGIEVLSVTLHVGLGTFRPVNTENIEEHHMHSESYQITEEVANRLNLAKKEERRIIAVGTTSTRTLEANYTKYGKFTATKEDTSIYLYPPYRITAIDALITNFHLPKSTLIMLVSCLTTKEHILNAYKVAVENKYRFFSFGDAMFIK